MGNTTRRPMGEGEDLAAKLKDDSPPGNLYRKLEEAIARRDAEKDAEFYSRDLDYLMEISPEVVALMDHGNIQDDSRVIKNFFEDTEREAAREESSYSSQLEITGQHKPKDVSHH